MTELPVVVIGAGPIGLAAAAQLRERGLTPLVFERGAVAGAAIAEWNHVRLFSRWSELVDPAARLLLEQNGWSAPDGDAYPTGQQWRQLYLEPLAAALGDAVQFGTEVVGVARRGRDLVVDAAARPNLSPFTCAAQAAARTASSLRPSSMRPALGAPRTRSAGKDCPPSARRLPDPRSPTVCPISTTRQFVLGSPGSTLSSQVAAIPH